MSKRSLREGPLHYHRTDAALALAYIMNQTCVPRSLHTPDRVSSGSGCTCMESIWCRMWLEGNRHDGKHAMDPDICPYLA